MHKISFYPLNNADCCKIELEDGRLMLFDFANYVSTAENSISINLGQKLKDEMMLSNKEEFDVVGFTHADDDHIHGAAEYFWFEHAAVYQSEDRVKIKELWVPAAMILEDGLEGDSRIIRQEARYRLINGSGIKVFSRPECLKEWIARKGIDFDKRKELIIDAGKLIPGYDSAGNNGVEIFVHSPFAEHADGGYIERNEGSLIFHMTFSCEGINTKFFLIGDTTHEVLSKIVDITKYHNNEQRLEWDVFDVPHHSSYLALSSEKGDYETSPVENVKWLLEQGNSRATIVSCSKPTPTGYDDVQPPHLQAINCYKRYASKISGNFIVTTEFPDAKNSDVLTINIDRYGAMVKKAITGAGASFITSTAAPRAGVNG